MNFPLSVNKLKTSEPPADSYLIYMKKILFLLTFLGLVAALGVAGYFASKTREVFEVYVQFEEQDVVGHTHINDVSGVTVHLFESGAVDKWLADPLVSKFLSWKDLERELELLDELLSLYQSLESIHESNSSLSRSHKIRSSQLAEYSSQLQSPILAASAEFPEALFKQLQESIPDSIFEATLSIFVAKRESLKDPVNKSFFTYIEKTFPSMTPNMLETLRTKLDTNPWDKYIGYKPRFTADEGANIIRQFISIDKIVQRMIQYAVNEKEIINKAPEPISIQQTDLDGKVTFKINRYSKIFKINSTTQFVVIAVSSNTIVHPGKVYAWMKALSIDQDALLPEEKLFFIPAKQSYFLSNKTASAEITNQAIKDPPLLPGAKLTPLKFGKESDGETKFLAINYLSRRGKGGRTHLIRSPQNHITFGSHDHAVSESPIQKPDFDLLDERPPTRKHSSPAIQSVDQLVTTRQPASPQTGNRVLPVETSPPSIPSTTTEDLIDELLDEALPGPKSSISKPTVTDPAIQTSQILGTWVNNKEEQTYKFGDKNSFSLSLEGFPVLSGYFNIDHTGTHNIINLVDHTDGAIIPALIKLESQNELKFQMGIKEKEPPLTFSPEALLFRRIR